jgi:ADP-heptose:LPS heptosyltransferase
MWKNFKPSPMFLRVKTTAAGRFNRARLGFPAHYFQGTGGIGDDLMGTTVFRELKKRGTGGIAVSTQHPGLFQNNPDVDKILWHPRPRLNRWLREGLPLVRLGYAAYDPARDRDEPPDEHILIKICRLAGLTGPVALRPYLFLTPEELAGGKLARKQMVMQSTGMASAHFMRNKEWQPQRFQEVCAQLCSQADVIQLGSANDPKLAGAMDLRGKTTLRQSAAILANSLGFVGLVGFLMHLARAVDCRAVIVYGGREKPSQTGYVANHNLYSPVECAPCWLRNHCEFDHKCMDMITSEQVIAAAAGQIGRHGTLLEVQTADIQA